ncbi:BTB/POZ and MATH domain-containing 2-like protein [Rhynchospora pubera]|nr:BTB/POZ and MATH domain-containing 2-like protein [Rhynchospora pubera]
MFGTMDQTSKRENVAGITAVVFKGLIHFMYTDALPDLNHLVSGKSSEASSISFYQDLIVVADQYKVKGLQTLCEDYLCRTISVGTVVSSLTIAEENSYGKLKEECFRFILDEKNCKAITLTRAFHNLVAKWPSLLDELLMKDQEK